MIAGPSGVLSIMTRTNPIPAALAALFLAALAGVGASCSTFGSVSVDEFLVGNAELLCGSFVACQTTPDEQTCEASLGRTSRLNAERLADLEAGTVVFDGRAAAECLDYLRRHEKDCDRSSRRADPGIAVCERVFVGVVPVGGACFRSGECADGSCRNFSCDCAPSQVDCCCVGTCARAARLGETCGETCEAGLACVQVPGEKARRCEPLREPGEPCDGIFSRCVLSVVCTRSEPGGTGVCAAAPAEGEDCVSSPLAGCARDDDWCDSASGICARRLPLGAACVPSGGDGPCGFAAVCTEGTCSLPPAEGDVCLHEPGLLFQCGGGLICEVDVCVVNPAFSPGAFSVCR